MLTEDDFITSTDPVTESVLPEDCCEAGGRESDLDLVLACGSTITEENESFSWNEDQCTRSFDIVTTYFLPGDDQNVLSTGTEPSSEPTSDDDCCRASEGTDLVLLQACNTLATEENESFSWNDGVCTRAFD